MTTGEQIAELRRDVEHNPDCHWHQGRCDCGVRHLSALLERLEECEAALLEARKVLTGKTQPDDSHNDDQTVRVARIIRRELLVARAALDGEMMVMERLKECEAALTQIGSFVPITTTIDGVPVVSLEAYWRMQRVAREAQSK